MLNECSSPALIPILSAARNIIGLIGIIAPILLLIMASVHLINLVRNPEDKKLLPKLRNSFIAAAVVFMVPVAVNALMSMLGSNMTISECWNQAANYSSPTTYMSTSTENNQTLYTNSDEYEHGEKKPTGGYTGETIEGTARQVGDVVWDPNDVTKISNLTSSQLIGILEKYGGNARNFIPYASGLITAEQKYHVNVFFLIGIEALESGWVTSSISRNCNNLGGVCQSSNHPSNGCGSNSNCAFAYFSSVNEFVDYHASMLHNNYLTPGGTYYHGATPSGVVVSYCPGCSSWPGTVTAIANELFDHVSDVL